MSHKDRLAKFRTALSTAGLDGFIINRADMYQGEEVRAADERLAWLTGFTGSAGVAVILADTAAFFPIAVIMSRWSVNSIAGILTRMI